MAENGQTWTTRFAVGNVYLQFNVSENIDAGNNISSVNWSLYIVCDSGSAYNGNNNQFYVNIDGSRRVTGNSTYSLSSGQSKLLTSGTSQNIGHEANGTKAINVTGYYDEEGNTISRTYSLKDFDRSAKTPYYTDITRTSATNFITAYAATGSVNGPTTYVLERATNSVMSGITNFSSGNSTVDANTSYWFRMYAYGDEGGAKYSGVYGPYHGAPTVPLNVSATRSTSVAGRVSVSWSSPSYVGGGISYYHLYKNGSYLGQYTETSVNDDDNTRGSTPSYAVYAYNGFLSSISSSASAMAPGVPGATTFVTSTENSPNPSRVGRNLTVRINRVSNFYGNTSSDYRLQYSRSDDNYSTWYGWNGTSDVLNSYNDVSSGTYTYNMFTPAKTYRFRTYAVNSIGSGDTATTDSFFLPASGKRLIEQTWTATAVAKRYNSITSAWVDISTAKRYLDGNWVELS